ncbi:TIGR04066 family peptide maturation system protein [Clostridium tagluense]|uniref:TIGR04066 family peptide maturation system protein n=1 Tax=Clostridium tagluense TaxID=360422 RepID=UPI001C6F04D0|nr:TIGR04066 family peptide maturation system protein [Clostridium tagluense]MBW9159134.1 TIGR04066 family peptide maturation system protein [Clostridium tagluense]WLC68217.1 TIGR04066 family peptide maturation system protein [Clostridium tagluense]
MKKIMLYPFNEEFIPLINHCNMLQNMDIVSIVSLKGNGYLGDKYTLKGKLVEVSEDFDMQLKDCSDILCFTSGKEDIDKVIFLNVEKAVSCGKKIIFFDDLSLAFKKFKELVPISQQVIIPNLFTNSFETQGQLYNINTPVIFVCSAYEGLNKFDIQLALRKSFLNANYRLLQIGTRQGCELFNFHSFPKFMYDNTLTEKKKILLFNNWLKKLEIEYTPDIIILGISGGAIPFSAKAFGDFGITLYEILQAVDPDCTILSLPYGKYEKEDILFWENFIKRKFNIEVDYYNIAPKVILKQSTESSGQPAYLRLDEKIVNTKIEELSMENIYNLLDVTEVKRLTKNIVDQFSKYGSINSV